MRRSLKASEKRRQRLYSEEFPVCRRPRKVFASVLDSGIRKGTHTAAGGTQRRAAAVAGCSFQLTDHPVCIRSEPAACAGSAASNAFRHCPGSGTPPGLIEVQSKLRMNAEDITTAMHGTGNHDSSGIQRPIFPRSTTRWYVMPVSRSPVSWESRRTSRPTKRQKTNCYKQQMAEETSAHEGTIPRQHESCDPKPDERDHRPDQDPAGNIAHEEQERYLQSIKTCSNNLW